MHIKNSDLEVATCSNLIVALSYYEVNFAIVDVSTDEVGANLWEKSKDFLCEE